MRTKFYYFKDEQKRPVITVCLVISKANNLIARGIAICSKTDMPCKQEGRNWAGERALAACAEMESAETILTERAFSVHPALKDFFWKSDFMPTPNKFELQLIGTA